jgi:hypothetical protein
MSFATRKSFLFLFIAALLSLAAPHAFAQATGSIRGTVVDPSGAVIPGAHVSAVNTATTVTRSVVTNEDGIYVFPDLAIGTYSLSISRDGFKTEKRSGIQLLTAQTIDLRIPLSVGSATQSVEVSVDGPLIQTTSSAVQTSVEQTEVRELPLNERNPLQLTTLTPGVVETSVGTEATQQDNTGISVNGLRTTQNTFLLDGAVYNDRFFDSVPTLPNPDALQEFTIQSSNYSAEYGGAGALVQLSTRSGTDQYHGTAYEFFRNTVLNAFNYFKVNSPATGLPVKPPFKVNQFGGTVGGPIIKGRTFFFFSAEDLEQRASTNPTSIVVPTNAELGGDFSALLAKGIAIYNPSTGLPYPGNIIYNSTTHTGTTIDALSGNLAQKYIVPLNANQTTGSYSLYPNNDIASTQYLGKIDHRVSANNHLSGRYFYNQYNFQRPFTAPLGFYSQNLFRNQSGIITDTHIFSPTFTVTFEASGGRFARTQIPEAPGLKSLQDLGANVPLGAPGESIFPGIRANISGYVDIFSGGALTQDSTSFDYKASAVKVLQAHTITFGAEFERDRIDMDDYSYTPGDNTFNGQRTAAPTGATLPVGTTTSGSALADFYLGLDSQFFQDNGRKAYLREVRPSLYANDDWRTTQDLTLNLGLRWDPWLPPNDLNDTLVGFNLKNPTFQSIIAPGAPLGMEFQGDPGLQSSIFRHNWKDYGPRVGFAYNLHDDGKTVVRGAYGIFYGFPEGLLYQRTDAMQPVDLYLSIPAPASAWDNIYSGYPGGDPFPRAHVGPSKFGTYTFLTPVSGGVLDPASKVAYVQNWNLTLEQQLPGDIALSLGYVGNRGEHIMGSRQFNPAVYTAGAGDTVGNENSRRLYSGLGAVELAESYENSIYHSLQINAVRRSRNGLTVLSNLVWGKAIDNNSSAAEGNDGPHDPYNLNSGYGPADFDQKIRYNLSLNYPLPHFNLHDWADNVANDWQINAIASFQTGLPFTVLSGTDRSLSGVGNDFADSTGQSTARPAGYTRVQQYFNKAAFKPAATGTFGDVGRNGLRGPGYGDVDLSLVKEILPQERIHAQFRAEAFNTLNQVNFSNPTATFTSGTYGQITSAGSPRVLQFGLKLLF